MKKSNLKRITIGVISFALIAAIGFSYHDAEAEESCQNLDSTFERAENKNQIKITATGIGNVKGVLSFTNIKDGNTSLVAKINCPNNVSYDVTNNKTVEIEIPKGEICTVDYNNTETGFSLDTVLAIEGTKVENEIHAGECIFKKSVCEKVNENNNKDIYNVCQNTQKDYIKNSPYLMHFEYEIGSKKTDKVRNTSRDEGGVCNKFVNSNKDFFIKELGLSENDYNNYSPSKLGKSAYSSTLTYCYDSSQEYVDAEISDKQLISTMKLAVKTQKFNSVPNKIITIVGDEYNLSTQDAREKFEKYFIDNTKSGGTDSSLKCDPYILEQRDKNKTDELNYYVNNRTYSAYSVTTTGKTKEQTGSYSYQCKKTCKEKITVSYGPPVGRIAGMCFEYKVKVKSIVDCGTEFTGQPPTMPKPTVCNYTPWCVKAHTTVANQAGPNEEFDACVIDCDGGKYTDKCTKKCYKKVYSNSTRKLSLFYGNNIIAKEMANSSLIDEPNRCYGEYASILGRNLHSICSKKSNAQALKNDGSECSKAIKDIVNLKGNYGEYVKENGEIVWKPSKGKGYDYTGCHWAKYSPFYFTYNSNTWSGTYEPERTVTDDYTASDSNTWTDGGNKYYPDTKNITGIKRRKNNGGCSEECHYEQNGTCSGTSKDYENAVEKYTNDLADYENAMASCTAKVTCTTKTAEFTIKVNNKLKGQNKDNWIDYGVIGLTPNKESVTESISKIDFILDHNSSYEEETNKNGTCYADTIVKENTYLTEWSFPGTWVNQKTGEISYVEPSNTSAWKSNKDKFCTSLDSAEVNKVWWQYVWLKYKAPGGDPQSQTEDSKKAIMSDLEYNILATARNFGYFGWNFDFKCFYSYSNDEPCEGDGCDPESKTPPTADKYINRSIELTDNFPKQESSNLTDANKTGREPGYNWRLEASNVKNINYEVTPSALTESIQSRGYKIYEESNSDKYKDYEFVLSKDTLKQIRNYNKSLGYNYKNYGEKSKDGITIKNGISCYRSQLIREIDSANKSKYNDELCVNNYNESSTDETSVKAISDRNDYIQGLRRTTQGVNE